MRIAVTAQTLRVPRRNHWPAALMFLMTDGAGALMHDVGLMERAAGVAFLAMLVETFVRQLQCGTGR